MFYYCAKCANIENIKSKSTDTEKCKICDSVMNPVPQEYLMSNGTFFKSQEERKRLILEIQSGADYDQSIGTCKEEIRQQKADEEQAHIEEMNEQLGAQQFKMKCPVCGSTSVQKISAVGKYAKVYAFGLLGADTLGKTWKCNVCGTKF